MKDSAEPVKLSDMDRIFCKLMEHGKFHLFNQMEVQHIGRSTIQRVKQPE